MNNGPGRAKKFKGFNISNSEVKSKLIHIGYFGYYVLYRSSRESRLTPIHSECIREIMELGSK